MHKLYFLLFFLLFSPFIGLFAQNGVTYDIHPGSKYKAVELEPALDMCDLTKYRKLDKRVKMLFDDETIVELYSAKEMLEGGQDIDLRGINPTDQILLNMFSLADGGYLIEWADKLSKEETIRRLNILQD